MDRQRKGNEEGEDESTRKLKRRKTEDEERNKLMREERKKMKGSEFVLE